MCLKHWKSPALCLQLSICARVFPCHLITLFTYYLFHQVEPSSSSRREKGDKTEQKQINAELHGETRLGLATRHLSSVFHNHSLSRGACTGFFNCPSAGRSLRRRRKTTFTELSGVNTAPRTPHYLWPCRCSRLGLLLLQPSLDHWVRIQPWVCSWELYFWLSVALCAQRRQAAGAGAGSSSRLAAHLNTCLKQTCVSCIKCVKTPGLWQLSIIIQPEAH